MSERPSPQQYADMEGFAADRKEAWAPVREVEKAIGESRNSTAAMASMQAEGRYDSGELIPDDKRESLARSIAMEAMRGVQLMTERDIQHSRRKPEIRRAENNGTLHYLRNQEAYQRMAADEATRDGVVINTQR